ncbi:MAG TPA: DUF350 domain-containing protein [Planctomycetota bacterium]|nr:DUF350 domain-containing protein [Planctomycetota bacterium]
MAHFLLRAAHASVVLLEVIALVWVGKKALEFATRTRFREELMVKDNPAAGVALAGFTLSLFLAISGLLDGQPSTLAHDALVTGIHGIGAIVAIVISSYLWRPLVHVTLREDILTARNVGAGLVTASVLVASGLIYRGAVHNQGEDYAVVAAFFAIGEGALLLYLLLYEWVTPYNVYEEISAKTNVAAAISFSGATIAAGLILGNAVEGSFSTWKESIRDALLYMIPLLGLPFVRLLLVNGLFLGFGSVNREIVEDRNTAAGLVEASSYVGMALFAVHFMG